MESPLKKHRPSVCNEINAESENHLKKIGSFSHKRKKTLAKTEPSIFGKHGLCFPNEITVVFGHGLLQPRRYEVPHWKQEKIQGRRVKIFLSLYHTFS